MKADDLGSRSCCTFSSAPACFSPPTSFAALNSRCELALQQPKLLGRLCLFPARLIPRPCLMPAADVDDGMRQVAAVLLVAKLQARYRSHPSIATTITISASTNSSVSISDDGSNSSTLSTGQAYVYGDSELGYTGLRTIVPGEVTYQSPARLRIHISRCGCNASWPLRPDGNISDCLSIQTNCKLIHH